MTPTSDVLEYLRSAHKVLVGGAWKPALSGATTPVLDPATARVIAQVPECDANDIDEAVRAARASFDGGAWSRMGAGDRTRILLRFVELIEGNSDRIAQIDVFDNGMPMWFSRMALANAVESLRYAAMLSATLVDKNLTAAVSTPAAPAHAYISSGPIGVVGLITPWNGPAAAFLVKIAPALAAGCCCVAKPAENTPLSALLIAGLALEAGLPPGTLNVVTGLGHVAGQALVDHPMVDKISFTGSTQVGKKIVQSAAGNLKRVTLELGGKSPNIIFDDADMDRAIPASAFGAFVNSGQICVAGSRLFIQRTVFDQVVEGIAGVARAMKVGNGFADDTQLGPVVSALQQQRIRAYVDRTPGSDAIVCGDVPDGDGFFVAPTILTNMDRDAPAMREEIFGPVVVATPFDDEAEVVAMANDSRYGLAAGLFTRDVNRAHKVSNALQAGNIWVNCYGATHPMVPFGGLKESGWGREFGAEGLEPYLERKSVVMQLS